MDRLFLRLDANHALASDGNQWILQSRAGRDWRSVSFIASTKRVLRRVIGEYGISLTPEAAEYLDAMPATFGEWQKLRDQPHGPGFSEYQPPAKTLEPTPDLHRGAA